MGEQHEITEQLVALRRSDNPTEWDRLMPLVYSELRGTLPPAAACRAAGHTLATALVHEAY